VNYRYIHRDILKVGDQPEALSLQLEADDKHGKMAFGSNLRAEPGVVVLGGSSQIK
jgi:hypothetical protein